MRSDVSARVSGALRRWVCTTELCKPATTCDDHRSNTEQEGVEIVRAKGLPNRRYLFVPSQNAAFGGVMTFSGAQLWTAYTQIKAT